MGEKEILCAFDHMREQWVEGRNAIPILTEQIQEQIECIQSHDYRTSCGITREEATLMLFALRRQLLTLNAQIINATLPTNNFQLSEEELAHLEQGDRPAEKPLTDIAKALNILRRQP